MASVLLRQVSRFTQRNTFSSLLRGLVLLGLIPIAQANYLLFHGLVELYSVVIAYSIFILAWNSQKFQKNGYLLFLGITYLFIGAFDVVHTLAYKGMGVFPQYDSNLPTQLWIASRYVAGLAFVVAPTYLNRPVKARAVVLAGLASSVLILYAIFEGFFPAAYIEGSGLTPFKIYSEYVIVGFFLIAGVLLYRQREAFEPDVIRNLLFSLVFNILAELAFTQYVSVYGPANMLGHLLKVLAYYYLYKALIVTGFLRPYDLLFRDLRNSQKALTSAYEDLEKRVRERTIELDQANRQLMGEIAERRQAERVLDEQRMLLQTVLQEAGDGVIMSDEHNHILFMNAAAQAITKIRFEEGLTYWTEQWGVAHNPDGSLMGAENRPLARALRGEKVTGHEMRILRSDGSSYDLLISTAPLYHKDGAFLGAMAVFTDITTRKEAERTLQRTNEELEAQVAARTAELQEANKQLAHTNAVLAAANRNLQHSNQELESFAFVASHDLQEPLRKISTFSERLERLLGNSLDEDAQGYLKRLQDAANRMSRMIQDLLLLSRITTQAAPNQSVDLARCVRDALADLEMRVESSGGQVVVEEPMPSVYADPVQIRQLFLNLIGNALKFRRPDMSPKVVVSACEVGEGAERQVEIRVSDNGIGFEEKYTEQIFQPFQRLHGRTQYEGNGMGLAICSKIAARHGGKIEAHSTPDQGTTFVVTLPVNQE